MFGQSFSPSEKTCSGACLSQVLREYGDDSQDALLRLRLDDSVTDFLVVNGGLWPTYIVSGSSRAVEETARVLDADWTSASLAHVPLQPFVLRAAKIFFSTNPLRNAERLSAGDYYALLSQSQQAGRPGMVWAECGSDEFFIFCPGEGKPIDQIVDIAAGELVADPLLVANLIEVRCAEVAAAAYPFLPGFDAWQEYRLHRYFCEVSEAILSRYGELTGRVMVQSLTRAVNLFAANYSWPVEIRTGKVIDCLVLPDLEEYQRVYQAVLAYMLEQAAVAIGPKLIDLTLTGYINSQPETSRAEILSLLPENFVLAPFVGD